MTSERPLFGSGMEWLKISSNLIDSMPKRVAKVVEVNGNAIEY
jgi:hypothetical protein